MLGMRVVDASPGLVCAISLPYTMF